MCFTMATLAPLGVDNSGAGALAMIGDIHGKRDGNERGRLKINVKSGRLCC